MREGLWVLEAPPQQGEVAQPQAAGWSVGAGPCGPWQGCAA